MCNPYSNNYTTTGDHRWFKLLPSCTDPRCNSFATPCATNVWTENPPKNKTTMLGSKYKKREQTQTRRKSFDVPDQWKPCGSSPTTNHGVQRNSSLTTRSNVQLLDRRGLLYPYEKEEKIKSVPRKPTPFLGPFPRCHDIPFLLHTHRLSSMIIVRWTNIVFNFIFFFPLFYFYVQTDASLLRLPRSHTRHVLQRL